MTQNLCLKQEKLLQPQEEDIKGFSKGEQTSIFFLEIFPTNCLQIITDQNISFGFSRFTKIS